MAKWTVKDGTQVFYDGKLHTGGDSFSASEDALTAEGLTQYVDKAAEKAAEKAEKTADKAADKVEKAESKAQPVSSNKAMPVPEAGKTQGPASK